jgi:hypothetical protein
MAIVIFHALERAKELNINIFGTGIEGSEDQNEQLKQAA